MNPTPPSPDPTVAPQEAFSLPALARHYSAAMLLGALGLLFLATPFVYDWPNGVLVETVLISLVMALALFAVGGRRRTLIIGLLMAVPAMGGKWINHVQPGTCPSAIHITAAILLYGFVVTHLIRYIVLAPRVDVNVLCAGMAGFLLLGLLWTAAYLLVARTTPGAFEFNGKAVATLSDFEAFYFSFATLSTVGYGDLAPVSNVARMLAVLEAVFGLLYMAVMISRLVSIYKHQPFGGKKKH